MGGKIPKVIGIVLAIVLIAISIFFFCGNEPVKSDLKISYSLPNSQNKITGSAVENATGEVTNLVLEDGAKVDYGGQAIDLSDVDLESSVKITNTSVYVDSESAPELDKPAKLTFYNVNIPNPIILEDGEKCPDDVCSNIALENEVLSFDVAHFTNYSYSATTKLRIWDETDSGMPNGSQTKYVNDVVWFFANYTDATGTSLSTGKCNITFSGSADNAMTYDYTTKLYHYSRSLSFYPANYPQAQWNIFKFNVTCAAAGYTQLNGTDNATIRSKIWCGERPDANTCKVITKQTVIKDMVINPADINSKNLIIVSSGSINSTPGNINLTLNLTGNLTVLNGGQIYTPVFGSNSGNIKVFAKVVNVSGSIWSEGSANTGGYYSSGCHNFDYNGFHAGKIILNASEVYIHSSGSLQSVGIFILGSWLDSGHGNDIDINATKIHLYAGSLLSTAGGYNPNSDNSACSAEEGGNGGNININSNSIMIDSASKINLSGGMAAHGAPGYGGVLNITADTISYRGAATATNLYSSYDGAIYFNFNNNMTRLSGYSYKPTAWIELNGRCANSNNTKYSGGSFFDTNLVNNTNWVVDDYKCHVPGSYKANKLDSLHSVYLTGLSLLNISTNATISGLLDVLNTANLQVGNVLKVASGATLRGFKNIDPDLIDISGKLNITVDNANISGKNLILRSTGVIYSNPSSYSFKINMTENATIMGGGAIYTEDATWESQRIERPRAGHISIYAKNINISGEIRSLGNFFWYDALSADCNRAHSGGNIKINTGDNIYLSGVVQSIGQSVATSYSNCGGKGGNITLSAGKMLVAYNSAILNAYGGETNAGLFSEGGNAGRIVLIAKNISAKNMRINASGGKSLDAVSTAIGGNGSLIIINAGNISINGIIDINGGTVNPSSSTKNYGYAGSIILNASKNLVSYVNITAAGYNSSYNGEINFTRLCGWDRGTYSASANYKIASLSEGDLPRRDAILNGTQCGAYTDNCPFAFNPSQYDSNYNGIGDACDSYIEYRIQNQTDSLVDFGNQPVNITSVYRKGTGENITASKLFEIYLDKALVETCTGKTTCNHSQSFGAIGTHNITIVANGTNYPYANISFNFTVTDILISRTFAFDPQFFERYNVTKDTWITINGNMSYAHNNQRLADGKRYELWIDSIYNTFGYLTYGAGYYQSSFDAGGVLGNHIAKINISLPEGIHGETSILYTVWVDTYLGNYLVQGVSATSDNEVDIDDKKVSVNITYFNESNDPIPGTINITLNSILKSCPSASTCMKNFSLGSGGELPSLGTYDINFTGINKSAYYKRAEQTGFILRVTNISISETIAPDHASPNQLIAVTGRAFYADDNSHVSNKRLSFYLNGTFNGTELTNGTGHYRHTFYAYPVENAGIYNVSVNYTDAKDIDGNSVKWFGIFKPTRVQIINWTYNKATARFNISANYTRTDTNEPISGNWNVILKNTKIPSQNITKHCYGKNVCNLSFTLGTGYDVRGGNTTIIARAENESAYFNSSSYSFKKYLEEKTTGVSLWVQSRVITDKVSAPYSLNITAILNNTGFGTAYKPTAYVVNFPAGFSSPSRSISCKTNLSPSDIHGNVCRLNFTINISTATGEGNYEITWRANFTNNDKTLGLASQIKNTINISGIATVVLVTPFKRTINHSRTASYITNINNTGTTRALDVNVTFKNLGLPRSWVNWKWANAGNVKLNGLLIRICDLITIGGGGTFDSYCVNTWKKAYEPINITVSVPAGTSPGNYVGILNFSYCFGPSCSQKYYKEMLLNITVPRDNSWHHYPKISNKTIGLNIPGVIETIFINNTGNVNENFTVTYGRNLTDMWQFNPDDNPSSITVLKNSLANFSLIHDTFLGGDEGNYILEVNLSNATASPPLNITWIHITIVNLPPSITITNLSENPVDVNKQINVTANITNDDNDAYVRAWCVFNHTMESNRTLTDTPPGSMFNKIATCSYTPHYNGTYKVTVFANDSGNRIGNTSDFFSAWGYTNLNITRNISAIKIHNVTQADLKKFSFNITVKNIGHARAYITNLTALAPSGWLATITKIGTIVVNQIKSAVVNITVPAGTRPGLYYVYPKAVWKQANNSIVGNLGESIGVNVTPTQRISLDRYVTPITVNHGTTNKSNFMLNSSGNTNLTSTTLSCSGTDCTTLGIILSPSYIANIAAGNFKRINMTISPPRGLAWLASGYFVTIGASNAYDSKSYSLNVIIPKDESYASKTNVTINTVSKYKSVYYYRINNTGNVNESFMFNITGGQITPIINLLKNETLITAQHYYDLGLNYTAPDISGTNIAKGNLTIKGPVNKVIPIVFNTYGIVLDVKNISKTSNIIAGNKLAFKFNISLAGTPLMENVSYRIYVGGNRATINYKQISSGNTTLNFTAPAARDGRRNNLTLETTYNSSIGVLVFNTTLADALHYRDVTPPAIIDEYSPSVELSNDVKLEINVTDNINISKVTATVNGVPHEMATTNNYTYKYTFTHPSKGDYDITYRINDTTNNIRTYSEYFEVFEFKHLNGIINDYRNVSTTFNFYRPNTTQLLYNYTTQHIYNLTLHKRNYDIVISLGNVTLTLRGVNATILPDDFLKLGRVPSTVRVQSYIKTLNGIGGNISLQGVTGVLTFAFNPSDIPDLSRLGIWKCSNWSLQSESCRQSWTQLTAVVAGNYAYTNLTSFSAYIFGQNNYVSPAPPTPPTTIVSGGGGGGASLWQIQQALNESATKIIEEIKKSAVKGLLVDTAQISRELYPGEGTSTAIKLKNTRNETLTTQIKVSGNVAPYIKISPDTIVLAENEEASFNVDIKIPNDEEAGIKTGKIIISSGEEETVIPVEIRILLPVGTEPRINIEPLSANIAPGNKLKVQVEIVHPVEFQRLYNVSLQLVNTQFGTIISEVSQGYAVGKTMVDSLTLNVPETAALGEYYVLGTLYYSEKGTLKSMTNSKPVSIVKPLTEKIKTFAFKKIAFLTVWQIVLIILCLGAAASAVQEYRVIMRKRKKYEFIVDYATLPEAGPRTVPVGVVAETNKRAFVDIDKLTMHTIVAGATGGGKTIGAQDIVEECLMKNIAVIVFDPTAQWSGFLRKCDDKKMIRLYSKFGISPKAARAFNGSIHQVTNPREVLDLKKFMKPGEINIITVNKLEPEEIDIFVANTVREIFRMNLPESPDLKTLIVYDEVHRLLPKYGGSGEGIIQLERGCREFRKWGVGLMLISQVLSDFVGEIKANISTEIQMRTRHEGDLTRISRKYGEPILHNLVRAGVGTGMIENAEWNKGHPYLITFRPILHSIKRLTDDELEKYNKYDNIIEDMRYELEQLKENKIDIYDLEIELNLASSKLKSGNFEMVEIYLDGIRPRITKHWQALGKTPKKREIRLVPEEEIKKEIEDAKKARDSYLARLRKVPEVELGQALREVVGETREANAPEKAQTVPAQKPAEANNETRLRELVRNYNELRRKVLEKKDAREAAARLAKTAEEIKKAMQTKDSQAVARLNKDMEDIEKSLKKA